jgi:hypothetical protein
MLTKNRSFLRISMMGIIITSAFISCKKDDNTPAEKVNYTISASASGANEIPAVATAGTGTATGTYNKTTNLLNYTVTWSNLSGNATLMHFHGPADATTNAGVSLGITGFTSAPSGTYTGSATLTDDQETQLLGGKWYYNVHTPAHGGGEIRGQVSVQ